MERPYDPYGGSINSPSPRPRVPDGVPVDGVISQQLEVNRRALNYRSRFETDIPAAGTPGAPGDVNRGSGV
jgi:hypothetical protein